MSNSTEKSKSQEDQDEIQFLQLFPKYRELLNEIEDLNRKLLETKTVKYFDTSALLRKFRNYQKLLDEEILTGKMHSNFLDLDKYNKIQVLKHMILFLCQDTLEEGETAQSSEVRAWYFLYMLVRFVESEKRFPRIPEMHLLLESNKRFLPSVESLLSKACKESPQVKSDIRQQKKERLHNTVGVGTDSNDER